MAEEKKNTQQLETTLYPYRANEMEQVIRYIDLMKLPKEATSSVIKALTSHRKMEEIIDEQLKLPMEKKKMLLDKPVADEPMRIIEQFVVMHRIPFNAMVWIEGKPYPKADGLKWKIQADSRILKSIKTIMLPAPVLKDNVMAGYHCDVDFWNQEHYDADGWADVNELQTRRRNSQVSIAFMMMIAETRAVRRAIMKSLGLPTSAAEDVQEGEEFEKGADLVTKPVAQAVKIEGIPTNPAQLIAKAQIELLYSPQEIVVKLGLKSLADITNIKDIKASWDTLVKSKGGQNVKESEAPPITTDPKTGLQVF